jgi:hypothetical protein
MHGMLPRQVILHSRTAQLGQVLDALIALQSHAQQHFPEDPLPRLALVADDILKSSKELSLMASNGQFRAAHAANIAVLISTSDANLLPRNVHTFATYVMATRCVLPASEPKILFERLFTMYESKAALTQALALCDRYEFLVGSLRTGAVARYVSPNVLPVFGIDDHLLRQVSLALRRAIDAPSTTMDHE